MADVYPLKPAYGLTKKINITTTSQGVLIDDWNEKAQGYTQILVTNNADDTIWLRVSNNTDGAAVDKDLPIFGQAAITISRDQLDKWVSVVGSVTGGTVWLTPIQGD